MIVTVIKDKNLKSVVEGMFGKNNIHSYKDLTSGNLQINPKSSEIELIITDGEIFTSLVNGKKNLDKIPNIVEVGIPIFLVLTNPKTKDKILSNTKSQSDNLIIVSDSRIEKIPSLLENAISDNISLYEGLQIQNRATKRIENQETEQNEVEQDQINIEEEEERPVQENIRRPARRGSGRRGRHKEDSETQDKSENTNEPEVLGSNIESNRIEQEKDFAEVEPVVTVKNLVDSVSNIIESKEDEVEVKTDESDLPREQYISSINNIGNEIKNTSSVEELCDKISKLSYDILSNQMSRESKTYQINTETIQTLERDIIGITNIKTASPEEKFENVKKLIRAKLEYQAKNSDAITNSMLNIVNLIQNQASILVSKNIAEKEASLARIKQTIIETHSDPEAHIIERQKLITNIFETIGNMNKIVKATENLAYDVSTNILKGIPTNNPVINKNLANVDIVPSDFDDMINNIINGMMNGSVALSAIISPLETLLRAFIDLIQVDSDLLTEYQTKLDKVFVQNPESLVVFSGPTKHLLRLIVGGSGKSAATTILHDICSRRGNTLTIDLTEDNITRSYNDNQQLLEESLGVNKVLHDFLYIGSLEELNVDALISFISVNSSKYKYINVVVEDKNIIDKLSDYALSIINIGLNSLGNITKMANISGVVKDKTNVAKRFVIVGDIVDDIMKQEIVKMLNIDYTKDAFLIIPNLPSIPASEINKTQASYNPKVSEAYATIID